VDEYGVGTTTEDELPFDAVMGESGVEPLAPVPEAEAVL